MTTNVPFARARLWANPASTRTRIAAYSIDAAVVIAAGAATAFISESFVLTAIVTLQLALLLVIAEARTGATAGNLLMRIRTTRDDVPYSLGIGRSVLRAVVQGAGFAVGAVGAWVIVATGLADPHRMGRTWSDRVGRALVVKVPRPDELKALSSWLTERHAKGELGEPAALAAQAPAAPADAAPAPRPQQHYQAATLGTGAHAQALSGTLDAPLVPAEAPPTHVEKAGPQVLLTFDTGQRDFFAIPGVINLGRRPDRHAAEDRTLAVTDPDRSVSKTHLRIECRPDSIWLTDLESTNGSEIFDDSGNSHLLAPGQRVRLDEGARVRVGNRSFTIAAVAGDE